MKWYVLIFFFCITITIFNIFSLFIYIILFSFNIVLYFYLFFISSYFFLKKKGLGKTIQSVALLEYLCNIKGNRGPFIVVAPVSTLEQWRREIETWTNLNCVLYHGSSQSREIIRNLEWKFASGKKHKFLFKFNILVTSYQTILSDIQELSRIRWQYIIIDEGHRLKNNNSKLFIALQSFNVEHRLVLTGTPLQNNIQELWSILNYVDPVKFFELEDFERQYGNLNDSRHRKRLHKILSAYLLRRVKEDVFKSLPVKEETIIETELTTVQKQFYKAILNRNREFLCKGVKSSNVPSLINVMVELRKCCNHPFLINGAEEKIVGNLDQPVSQLLEALINSSAKLIILDKLLTKLRADGHQVLIFSQMTQLLNILEDYLIAKEYPYERLDGSVGLSSRQASIDRFSNKENDNFVFLLSTRAGGLGLNLTAANTVVIFDSDWNPQNDLQAQARCHRIGQTENVKIYRLVTKNTYESEMLNIASKKLGLEMVVLDTSNDDSTLSNGASKALDKDEIDHLLKSGAYELFNTSEEQDKDNEKKLFSEDINSILNRATTRKYDDESSSNKKPTLGNLSKVTYQIDIEDDFWESVLPEHKTSSGLLKQLKANKENEFLKQEVRDQFIQDIKDVIEDLQELLEARSKSFTFTNQSSVVTASKLIDAVINSDFFTSDEKLPLYSLQNSIINTKRERKTVDRTLPAENLVGMESNQTKKSKKEKKLSAAAAEAKKEAELKKETEWSKNLRDKVKTALTSLGPGRWEDITEFIFPNDSQKSKNVYQVRSLCESMIQQYFSRENIGSNELVTLKEDEQPIPKTQTTFYGKYIQSESNLICQKLESYYKSNKIRFTSNMKNDWSNVKIKIENESQFPTIDRVIVKKDTGTTRTVTLPLFEPGQKITLNFDNIPKAISESFIPVYVILRLIGDDKKEGNNCIIHEYSMENPVDSLDIIIPGYVGEYRIQIWAPLFTKTPDINTKKGPYVSLMVQCPEVLEPITRFAAQRWVTQCEFMKALEKLMNMQSPIRPTKLPIWWWNLIDDDDKNIIKGIYKYGYGRFSSIRSDSLFNYKDEDIKSKYETLWNSKSTQEKHNLGYSDENDSSKNDSSKKKLKDNPFEFPSTTTLNSHLKSFLKLNRLIEDTITSSTNSSSNNSPVIPKKSKISKTKVKKSPKSKTSVSTTKKNSTKKLNTNTTTKKKRKIVKKPILSSKQRDTSPENFVKKSKKSKKKHSSISSVSNVSSNSPKGSMPM